MPDQLLQGTLDLLILKALAGGALHGLGVSRRIDQMTGGTFAVQPGSLFPALHLLRRNPIFALTATLSIAVGIGANTAIVTVANALLLRPPYGVGEPDRIVEIVGTSRGRVTPGGTPQVAYTDYLQLRERTTAFTGMYGYLPSLSAASMAMSNGDDAERVFAGIVTSNYFEVLGVEPAAGRFFRAADGEEEGPVRSSSSRPTHRSLGARSR